MSKSSQISTFLLLIIGISFLISTFLFLYQCPHLSSISAQEISVGDTVVLVGYNLGDIQSSILMVGGYEVLPRSVVEWTSRKITFVLSENMSSGLIFVKNGFMRSNSLFFINQSQVPDFSFKNGMGAYLISLDSEKLVPTTEVTLRGRFLGMPSEKRNLVFQTLEGKVREVRLSDKDIISWTDSKIRFILPMGLSSGRLYLEDQGVKSNALPYRVDEQIARWDLKQEKIHHFKIVITLERKAPAGDESFYFWIPEPKDLFQIEQGVGTRALSSYSLGGWRVYLISSSFIPFITLESTYKLKSAGVQVFLNPDFVKPYLKNSAIVQANTEPSSLLANNKNLNKMVESFKISASINPHNYAQVIFNKLLDEFSTDVDEDIDLEVVSSGVNVLSYAQLNTLFVDTLKMSGIPAREVLGILQEESLGRYRLWQWAEIYLEDVGWIPIDIGFSAKYRDPYWLKLSKNHISLAHVPSKWSLMTLQGEMLSLKTIEGKDVLLAGKPWFYENVKSKGSLRLSSYEIESL